MRFCREDAHNWFSCKQLDLLELLYIIKSTVSHEECYAIGPQRHNVLSTLMRWCIDVYMTSWWLCILTGPRTGVLVACQWRCTVVDAT